MTVPAIAIHGSESTGKIAGVVDAMFRDASNHDPVTTVEFDWNRAAPVRTSRGLRNLYRFLRWYAGNVGAAARLGLEFSAHDLDGILGYWQVRVHRLLQLLIAGLVATWVGRWVAQWLVLAPMAWYGLPTAAFAPMSWLDWVMGWIQVAIGAGVVALLVMGALRLGLTLSPRPGIVTFRSIVLMVLQPFMVLGLGALLAPWWMLGGVVGSLAVVGVVQDGAGGAVPWAILFGVLFLLRRLWVREGLRGPVKFTVDLFRYLGEPACRSGVQRALDGALAKARAQTGDGRETVVLGVGLGSIIALDSIAHSNVWSQNDRVLLVTMGSPLRRFFLRFYPRTLFPEYLEDVVDLIAGRVGTLRWINVYRPFDYAGGPLGLTTFKGKDISTLQRDRVFDSHADYWGDPEVRRTIVRGLQRLADVDPLRVPMKDAAHRGSHPLVLTRWPQLPDSLRRGLRVTLPVVAFVGMVWWVGTGSLVLAPVAEASELLDRGVVTEADATHRRETVSSDRGITYVHHWAFEITDPAGTVRTIEAERDVSDAFLRVPPPRFDERALLRYIRNGCGNPRRLEDPCSAEALKVRYVPGEATLFDLPDFPRRRFGSDPLRGWGEVGAVAAGLTVLLFLALGLGARTFTIILG